MKKVDINRIELGVVEKGAGPVLLLVHGFPLDHCMWHGQIEGLSDRCRVIAPDLRGFGQSGGGGVILTMRQFADDLAALLEALDIREPVSFCGLSMGGYVAWQFWRRHATRLGRLILCDTRAEADTEETARARSMMVGRVLAEGASIAADAMIPKLFAKTTYDEQPELVEAVRRTMLGTQPASIAAAQRGMAERPDMTGVLAHVGVPTLVICGEHDAISPPAEMRALAAAIPGGDYRQIAGAGHMAPLERPLDVNAAIGEFLEL